MKSCRSALSRFGFKTVEQKQNEKGMDPLTVTQTIQRLNSPKRNSRWTQSIRLMSKKTKNWSKWMSIEPVAVPFNVSLTRLKLKGLNGSEFVSDIFNLSVPWGFVLFQRV